MTKPFSFNALRKRINREYQRIHAKRPAKTPDSVASKLASYAKWLIARDGGSFDAVAAQYRADYRADIERRTKRISLRDEAHEELRDLESLDVHHVLRHCEHEGKLLPRYVDFFLGVEVTEYKRWIRRTKLEFHGLHDAFGNVLPIASIEIPHWNYKPLPAVELPEAA